MQNFWAASGNLCRRDQGGLMMSPCPIGITVTPLVENVITYEHESNAHSTCAQMNPQLAISVPTLHSTLQAQK